jgi:hypothetical protein
MQNASPGRFHWIPSIEQPLQQEMHRYGSASIKREMMMRNPYRLTDVQHRHRTPTNQTTQEVSSSKKALQNSL